MKYLKDENTFMVLEFTVDKLNFVAKGKYIKLFNDETGSNFKIDTFHIMNEKQLIIDPEWTEESTPIAKPIGFDSINPMTWNNITWDEIPKVQDTNKLYATFIMNATNTEKAILEQLVFLEVLPKDGNYSE